MGYIEKIMGDNEQVVYRTHLHGIVLLQRTFGVLFAFAVFLAAGLTILLEANDEVRSIVGVIALGSLVMPLYLIIAPWMRGLRRREYARVIWRFALAGLAILVVGLFLMIRPQTKSIGWIAVALALIVFFELVRHLLDWLFERYIITNRRVMEIKGIINKHVRDSALEKVNDVDMKQSIVGRILGYGTVQIITGSDIGVNMFRRISNPVRFKRAMLNAKEQLHVVDSRPAEAVQEAPSTPIPSRAELDTKVLDSSAHPTIPELIDELDKLRQRGILSEEEFQTKKKELLARL
jgi:hypothetical protein